MKIELSKMEFDWKTSLLLFIISVSIFIKYLTKKTATNLPPGPPKLPILGNLHQLIRRNTVPHRRLAELAKLYGPIMHLRLGEVPTLVISSADLAAEVMKTHDAVFCSRPLLMVAKELFYGASDIGLAPYGEYWRQARKISVLELFTAKRVQSFRNIREEEAVELMNDLRSMDGCVVNLSKMMFGLTFNITTRIAFSKKGKEQEEFRAFTGAVTKASSGFSIADLYPSIEFLHSISGTKRKFKELVQESNRILDPIIDDHRANKRSGDQDQQDEDLVGVLLKFHKDNLKTHNNQEFSLSIDNMKAIILELFGAGVETSSTALEWAMSELLKNPNVMEKAQAEVRRVYQGKTTVDESMLNELKYMKHVIKETLRLHPPLPLLAPRESIESCRLHSYDIPSKTRVLINAWAIGRDPKYWSDPEKFDPERFEGSSIDYKGTDFELIPFGAGRRKCPGMTLGIVNVELPLAMLLYHFDWRLPHGVEGPQNLDMDESFGITIRRKNELYVIPVPYGH